MESLVELLDGLLLGDGSIEQGSLRKGTARFHLVQTSRHSPWIDQVQALLLQSGIVTTTGIQHPGIVVVRGKSFRRSAAISLRSTQTAFLGEQRERWYPGGVKHVPDDVRLTPRSIAQWYFGDGTVGGRGYRATFCTDGFKPFEVHTLTSKLQRLYGWTPNVDSRNRIMLCRTVDRVSLAEILSMQEVPECFAHKLQLKLVDERFKVTDALEDHVRSLRLAGLGYHRIAARLGLSKSGVAGACKRLGI